MGNKKRRQYDDNDDDDGGEISASDSEAPLKSSKSAQSKGKAQTKQKTIKKPRVAVSEEESSPPPEGSKKPSVKVLKNTEGEKYVDLGKKKRAAVRSFKGQVFLDIREYYGTDGDEKPGKKGISLQKEQWETLKRAISTLDSHFAEQDQAFSI